jgi:ribosomal protein S27E
MPVDTKRSSKVECLRCGHTGVLLESDLSDYGVKSDAPIASFIERLTCRACGNSRCPLLPDNDPAVSGASRDLDDHGKVSPTVRLG